MSFRIAVSASRMVQRGAPFVKTSRCTPRRASPPPACLRLHRVYDARTRAAASGFAAETISDFQACIALVRSLESAANLWPV